MNKMGYKEVLSKTMSILSYICLIALFLIATFLLYFIVSNQIAKTKGEKPAISIYTIVKY